MDRSDVVLAALAAGGENATFSPVQVQKLLFLVDRQIPQLVGGPHFRFQPYDFGPFDRTVYDVLETLAEMGLVYQTVARYRNYTLSPDGYRRGGELLRTCPPSAETYIREAADWVRRLSFSQLVAAIYRAFPEMKVNSIFRS
jgi:uncharacterized protein